MGIDNFHSLKAAQLIKCLSSLTALQMLATILSCTKPAIRIEARSLVFSFNCLSTEYVLSIYEGLLFITLFLNYNYSLCKGVWRYTIHLNSLKYTFSEQTTKETVEE